MWQATRCGVPPMRLRGHLEGRANKHDMPLYLLNKPYGILSQFSSRDGHPGLASLIRLAGYRPIGRLDRDSEGLLLLTNDGALANRIADPRHHWPKTYLAQVEGLPDAAALAALARGPRLADGPTKRAMAALVAEPDGLWTRNPPVRHRLRVPTSWLRVTVSEGRNRQVRRMTAAVGHPCLRLIRVAVGPIALGDLEPGDGRAATAAEIKRVHRYRPARDAARG
jgi:23S rRNA pseudouridine2457 synthase